MVYQEAFTCLWYFVKWAAKNSMAVNIVVRLYYIQRVTTSNKTFSNSDWHKVRQVTPPGEIFYHNKDVSVHDDWWGINYADSPLTHSSNSDRTLASSCYRFPQSLNLEEGVYCKVCTTCEDYYVQHRSRMTVCVSSFHGQVVGHKLILDSGFSRTLSSSINTI